MRPILFSSFVTVSFALVGALNYSPSASAKVAPSARTDAFKYPVDVSPLSRDNTYLRASIAPDFWALMPYLSNQKTNSDCSVATAVTLLNGMRRFKELKIDEMLLTPESILKRTRDKVWSEATAEDGGGISLTQFSQVLEKAFRAHAIDNANVKPVPFGDFNVAQLEKELIGDEASNRDFLIINFDQGFVMEDESVGHFALVGAYDAKKKRVLVLDPNKDWYEPYWVPLVKLYRSMAEDRGYIKVTY